MKGPVCQFVDECHSIPCNGSATCLTDAFGRHSCLCPRGWTGKNCSIDIDNCVSVNSSLSPCHHGSTCVNTPGSFVCQCVPGHTGNIFKDPLSQSERVYPYHSIPLMTINVFTLIMVDTEKAMSFGIT
ncbi:Heart of glass [Desmophyllum pertusum]|uniref:Heart of glass n=1 Tax=Desmophyllum pertusum TaxID=174260 RepID=A0A9W9YMY6_9CNID|nr:Heart of glass [Desmophyllum pertusum]